MTSLYIPDFSEMLAVSHSRGADSEAPDLWDDLVGLWPIAAGGGATAFDLSGYGRHGTLTNGPMWVATEKGWALDFVAASDQFVVTPALDTSNWLSCSIISLVQFDAGESFPVITDLRYSGNDGIRTFTQVGTLSLDADDGTFVTTQFTFNDTFWHTAASVVDGDNARIYLDGILKDEEAGNTFDFAGADGVFTIGARNAGGGGGGLFFDGRIALTMVSSPALAPSKIQQLAADPNAMLRLRAKVFPTAVAGFISYPYPLLNSMSGGMAT